MWVMMDYRLSTLGNGVRVVTTTMPGMYSVTLSVFLAVGSRHERPEDAGSAHLVEHMLFKGTPRRPTAEVISETIERVGGMMNASTDKEMTAYWAKVGRDQAPVAADLLADMLLHSLFAQDEVEKERRVVIEELGMSMDSPQEWVHTLIDERIWPDTALGRDVAGSRESVAGLSRGGLLAFHAASYRPDATVVSVAGGIEHGEALSLVAGLFGDWQPAASAPGILLDGPPITYAAAPPSLLFDDRDTEQVNFCLSLRGISRNSPDRYAFDLLTSILGGAMSSRLFLEIRERRGLAYDIHSYCNKLEETGSIVTYAAVEPSRCAEVVREIVHQHARLRTETVADAELEKAKDHYKGRLLLGLEDTQSVAGWGGVQQLLYGSIRQPEEVCAAIDRVEPDDLRRLADECFRDDYLRLVALGPERGQEGLREALHF